MPERLHRTTYSRDEVEQIIHDRLKEREELRRITDTDAKFDAILARQTEANDLAKKFDRRIDVLEKGAVRIVNWKLLFRDWRVVVISSGFVAQTVFTVWNAFYGVAHPLPHP